MTRVLPLICLLIASLSLDARTANAGSPTILSGEFQFFHHAVDPNDATICLTPVPGLAFHDVPGDFLGHATGIGNFFGTGTADTCAFFQPIFGIYAQFTGSFAWQTQSGRTIQGEFLGFDLNPLVYSPDGQPIVFETSILVVFRDQNGRFIGMGSATGLDDPFAVLSGDPTTAGVQASINGFLF
ncbi:hypothetical protein Mal15_30060 [Stieleria maiorica]|uniref:Uncharacterized protein n=1 Tax=Stieleria maiorica TaxID=2795974 RepID=A0A5B9MD06_9BACT|nr:hypothetical protein [Stieleria maiorica]QEF98948.1 hypothetical protein Mal15_30060 [Stieleria maiorica]